MKKAFTLAEVFITLGVIGVVTAMTLPAVINKIEEKQHIAMWKKILRNCKYLCSCKRGDFGSYLCRD